jgi:hypothetical protein
MTITIFYNTENTPPTVIENITKTTIYNGHYIYEPASSTEGIDLSDSTIDNIVTV